MTNRLFFVTTILFVGIFVGNLSAQNSTENGSDAAPPRPKYAIAIHGGAGPAPRGLTADEIESRRASMKKALEIGVEVLNDGGSSLDAVEKVILSLENDPQFNAGVGAVYNAAGGHELDASIMDGRDLTCGAVAGVSIVKNPISLARLVMTKTPHVLLAGNGAEVFAKRMKVELVDPSHFDTKKTKKAFQRLKNRLKRDGSENKRHNPDLSALETGAYYGTVGCVALDSDGNLAAGTSTGGTSNKQFGRVGDSPIIGAGTYADNRSCAVSCTGHGEQYIRNAVAYDISAQFKYRGVTIKEAAREILQDRLTRGAGGMIVVDKQGNIAMEYSSADMARAAADSNGRFEVFFGEELRAEKR